MRFAFLNTILAVTFYCGLSTAICAARQQEESQTQTQPAQPPENTQPQNEPVQPSQIQPAQAAPAEAPQTPPAQGAEAPPPPSSSPPKGSPSSTSKEAPPSPAKRKVIKKRKKPATKNQTGAQAGRVVVRNGGAREGTSQISPGMSDRQAQRQRENTNQLLATTDANLKQVSGKQLTPAQQGMLNQINSYVRQSKSASDSGDVSRAHTLAFKAHLLSAELARKGP